MQKVIYDRYTVNDKGDVFSFTYQSKGKKLKPILSGNSGNTYLMVALRFKGKSIKKKLHILVLEAFVGPRPNGCVARHLDGNRYNNSLDNLAWGTQKENAFDKVLHGTLLKGSQIGNSKLTEDKALAIKRSTLTRKEIANAYNICPIHVWQIKTGRRWRHLK